MNIDSVKYVHTYIFKHTFTIKCSYHDYTCRYMITHTLYSTHYMYTSIVMYVENTYLYYIHMHTIRELIIHIHVKVAHNYIPW